MKDESEISDSEIKLKAKVRSHRRVIKKLVKYIKDNEHSITYGQVESGLNAVGVDWLKDDLSVLRFKQNMDYYYQYKKLKGRSRDD